MRPELLARWAHGWWIDYIEGETDSMVDQAIEMLVDHSPLHKEVVENYKVLRGHVRMHGDVSIPTDDEYHDKLHAKIMGALPPNPERPVRRAPTLQRQLRRGLLRLLDNRLWKNISIGR